MANRAGLRKVVKTVRTKKGVVRRSYWVRASHQLKAGGLAAAAIGSGLSGMFIGGAAGRMAGAAIASRRAGQMFQAGINGGTADSLNHGAASALRHMNGGGFIGGIGGAVGGGFLGGAIAGRLSNYGAQHGLFKANTVWARRIGATAGALGGAALALHASHYADTNNRAERFRNAYNERVRAVRGE